MERRRQRDEYIQNHKFIVRPDGDWARRWDEAQIFLLVYLAILVPYRIGFDLDAQPGELLFAIDVCVDVYFIVDTVTAFFRAYYDDDGMLQYRPMSKLARRYGCSRWFAIDFAGCLPVNYIVLFMNEGETSGSSVGRTNKALRMLRLFKLLRLLRLARFQRIIDRHHEEIQHFMGPLRMIKISVYIAWITHLVACIWHYAGKEDSGEVNPDGSRVLNWVETMYGEEQEGGGAAPSSLLTQNGTGGDGAAGGSSSGGGTEPDPYIASLYYAAMTMTTVGYGDITPNSTFERVVCIACMLIGGFTFGMVVGLMSDITRNAAYGDSFKDMELGKIVSFLRANEVPPSVNRRIHNYFVQYYQQHSAVDVVQILDMLPEKLRDDLASHLSPPWLTAQSLADDDEDDDRIHDSLLHRVPFFCDLDNYSLILICSKMKIQTFPPAKRILATGEQAAAAAAEATAAAAASASATAAIDAQRQKRRQASLRQASLQQARPPVDTRVYTWDHYIVEEGERGNEMMVVVDGSCGVEKKGQHPSSLRPGDSFGEDAVLRNYSPRGHPHRRSVYASRRSVVAILSCVLLLLGCSCPPRLSVH